MPPFNRDGQKSGTIRKVVPCAKFCHCADAGRVFFLFFESFPFGLTFATGGLPRVPPKWVVCMPALTSLLQSISSILPLSPTGPPDPEDQTTDVPGYNRITSLNPLTLEISF